MAESIAFDKTAGRKVIYRQITPQIEALISDEIDETANLANVAAVLKEAFGFLWVGFYLHKGGELVLGPFQGPVACTRIRLDTGVCGHAFTTRQTTNVPDVDAFPGHIACSSKSRSELVVPLFDSAGNAIGVLDVDSEKPGEFGQDDVEGLEAVVRVVETSLRRSEDHLGTPVMGPAGN